VAAGYAGDPYNDDLLPTFGSKKRPAENQAGQVNPQAPFNLTDNFSSAGARNNDRGEGVRTGTD